MKNKDLKEFLEEKYLTYCTPGFIENDPVSIPHRYSKKEDIEIAAFLTAVISWGRREQIILAANRMMMLMDDDPSGFVQGAEKSDLKHLNSFVYRTFNGNDLSGFIYSLKQIYSTPGGMEEIFNKSYPAKGLKQAIVDFRAAFFLPDHLPRTEKHFAKPDTGSAAKRINLFLRWMVRREGTVDFGIWNKINPADLYCPLDVHTARVARELKLLTRKQNDWVAVEELSDNLRVFDPEDPVKYDFALFGLGMYEGF